MPIIIITGTGAGTWTAPVGVSVITVECFGGGGAGGLRSTDNSGAGGAGGGAYARRNTMAVTPSAVYSYTVGAGGTDGVTPADGGTTTFTGDASVVCSAAGATSVVANSQAATLGATTATGDVTSPGGSGHGGDSFLSGGGGEGGSGSGSGFSSLGSAGGSGGNGGDGGNGQTTSAAGAPGVQPGGGGGGGYRTTSTTRNGGAGGDGQIVITFTAYVFPAASGSYAVTGGILHNHHNVPSPPGVYALTGTDVGLTKGGGTTFALSMTPGAYVLTGTDVNLLTSVTADPGSYAITGSTAFFLWGHVPIAATAGSYTVTGTLLTTIYSIPVGSNDFHLIGADVGLIFSGGGARVLTASPGAYALTGTAAALTLQFQQGFYTLTGGVVAFFFSGAINTLNALQGTYIYNTPDALLRHTVPGDPGVYTLTGTDVTLRHGWYVTGALGTYLITAAPATLQRSFPLAADPGVYTLTGSDIPFTVNFLPVLSGTYVSTGSDVTVLATRYASGNEGFYPITGGAVTLAVIVRTAYIFPADAGVYLLTGTDATTTYTQPHAFVLPLAGSSYAITGADAQVGRTALNLAAAAGSYATTGSVLNFGPLTRVLNLVSDGSGAYSIRGATFTPRSRSIGGGLFAYSFGTGGDNTIIRRRRRR